MSHKKKATPLKTTSANAPISKLVDPAALAVNAEAELRKKNYKEASDLYKALLKLEWRPEWLESLAECYAGRACHLAEKGMFKEALVIWRNREKLCGKTLLEGPYLNWLVKADEQKELGQLLVDASLAASERSELEYQVAAQFLFGGDAGQKGGAQEINLPADSLLLRHRPAALAAWQALQAGDFVALNTCLQAIPFRSPYRDLKPLLKAMALVITDPVAADAAISRLPVGGAFERLAACVRIARLPDVAWLSALAELEADSQHVVLDLKGCPDSLRPLLLELAKMQAEPARPKAFFDWLLRHRQMLPEGMSEQFCRRLLPHVLSSHRGKFAEVFGELNQQDLYRLAALAKEVGNGFLSAREGWTYYAELLGEDEATHRQAALVWRRIAEFDGKLVVSTGDMRPDAFEALECSVKFDPTEQDMVLRLISELRLRNDLKRARVYLEPAMTRFPQNPEVLLEAMQVALAGQAFKKAIGFAKRVLELDPINPKVKQLVIHAYLSHARKLIKAGSMAGAIKELDAASAWVRGNNEGDDGATINLLRAFASSKGTPLAEADIDAILSPFGVFLVRAFRLLLEEVRIGLAREPLLRWTGMNLTATPSATEVIALVHALSIVREVDKTLQEKTLSIVLAKLRPLLKRAAKLRYTLADLQLVCEAWLRYKDFELLEVYAKNALKIASNEPIFVYFKTYAKCENSVTKQLLNKDRHELEQACAAAQSKGDKRTYQRINDLRERFYTPFDFMDGDEYEDGYEGGYGGGYGGGYESDDDALFPAGSAAMLESLLEMTGVQSFFAAMRSIMGKKAFNQLRKEIGGDDKTFAHALIKLMTQNELGGNAIPPFKF
jgi:hypothetical protein